MSDIVSLSEFRQRKRLPDLRLVSSRDDIRNLILEDAKRFARIIADMKPSDSEPPEGDAA